MAYPSSKIAQGSSFREKMDKSFISTKAFATGSGALFSYSTSVNSNLQTVGSLNLNPNNSAARCPAGRVVHVNGKVLYPNVHPGGGVGVNPTTGTGSTTPNPLPFPLIGVYDPNSGLNGYINPADPTWAVYDLNVNPSVNYTGTPDTTLAGQGAEPRFGRAVDVTFADVGGVATGTVGAGRVGTITLGGTPADTLLVGSTEVTANSKIFLQFNTYGPGAIVGSESRPLFMSVPTIDPGVSFTIAFYGLTVSGGTTATGATAAVNWRAGDIINYLIVN